MSVPRTDTATERRSPSTAAALDAPPSARPEQVAPNDAISHRIGRRQPDLAARRAAALRRQAIRGRIALRAAIAWLSVVTLVAVFADLLPLTDWSALVDLPARTAPRLSLHEPLGTDATGRSVLSRLSFGARQTLAVGIGSVAIAFGVGMTIGMLAGYLRGKVDVVISVILDSILAMPALVLLLAVAAIGKRDLTTVVIGLALVGTPTFARIARAQTLVLADREFVVAARAMGARRSRVLLRELLPNVILPLSSYAFLYLAIVMVAEGSLSFLGLGIPAPNPSWGGMINEGRPHLATDAHLVFVPAACLAFTVLSCNTLGDYARRRLSPGRSALS